MVVLGGRAFLMREVPLYGSGKVLRDEGRVAPVGLGFGIGVWGLRFGIWGLGFGD